MSSENDVEQQAFKCKFRCTSNRKRKCYAQRNADPKDCYCGEKECPGRAANRFRQVVSLRTYGTLRRFSGFWLQTEANSIVLLVSHLNALMLRDQVTRLRECGLKACILKGDRVALDGSLI